MSHKVYRNLNDFPEWLSVKEGVRLPLGAPQKAPEQLQERYIVDLIDTAAFPRGAAQIDPSNPKNARLPDARWADPGAVVADSDWRYAPGALFLGDLCARDGQTGQPDYSSIGIRDDRHMLTIAGSRSGKGRSVIIPNLLLWQGSALVIDPKGENARVTAARRGKGGIARIAPPDGGDPVNVAYDGLGQDVHVLDPFGTAESAGLECAAWNPLDEIDDTPMCVDQAGLIADGLVVQARGDNAYWTSAARAFLRGLILYCATVEQEHRNLLFMRYLLTLADKDFLDLLTTMQQMTEGYGVIARAANSLLSMQDKERASVLSSAREQTEFLDSPMMAKALRHSDFRMADLKRARTTVYLCLPASFMGTHARWMRVVINMALDAMEHEKTPPELPVLFLMDEFPVLGHMDRIEKAAGQIAGFGVRLWPFIQDLSQLKQHYRDSWETFVGNAGVLQAFGNTDQTTLKYLSDQMGKTAITTETVNPPNRASQLEGLNGTSRSWQVTELMTPEEIGRTFARETGRQLVIRAGQAPVVLHRTHYDAHPHLRVMCSLQNR